MSAPAVLGYPDVFEEGARRLAAMAEEAKEEGEVQESVSAQFGAAAVMLAVASVEASVGEFLYLAKEEGLVSDAVLSSIREKPEEETRPCKASPYEKCKTIANEIAPEVQFAIDEDVTEFRCVYQLRNAITHYQRLGLDRGTWPPEVSSSCREVLNRQMDIDGYDWTSVALTPTMVRWAVDTSVYFRQEWRKTVRPRKGNS